MSITRLIYFHDPMCSWCYAFEAAWTLVRKNLPDEVIVEYKLGGLAFDSTEPMTKTTRKMVQENWRRIEKTLPQIRFNFDFWEKNTPYRSTYPACRAVLATKKQDIHAEKDMIRAIQKAYYQDAKNPSLNETLIDCAAEIGLNTEQFTTDLLSEETRTELMYEVQSVRDMRVYSFPSLRLIHQDNAHEIIIDYQNGQKVVDAINKIINSE